MRDIVHGLEHQKQGFVVALELGPLVGVHGVFDGQRVQAEHVSDHLHLVFVGFMQPDPDECGLTVPFEFVDLRDCLGVAVLLRQPFTVHVHTAVDHGPRNRDVNGLCVRVSKLVPRDRPK